MVRWDDGDGTGDVTDGTGDGRKATGDVDGWGVGVGKGFGIGIRGEYTGREDDGDTVDGCVSEVAV